MEIGGINGKLISNTIDNAARKAEGDNFEARLKKAMDKKDDKELKKVCQEFEQIFLNIMYKQMKQTVPKSELMPDDASTEIFDSMMDDKLMEEAAKNNSFGLGNMMYRQLSKQLYSAYEPSGEGETHIEGKSEK